MEQEKMAVHRSRTIAPEYLKYQSKRKWYFLLNSLSVFILTYLLVYLFNQILSCDIALMFKIPCRIYYFEIQYLIGPDSPKWTSASILSVSLIPSLIILVFGILLLKKADESSYKWHNSILFNTWLGFQSISFFLGGLIGGSLTGRGSGYALDLFFWPQKWVYFLICVVAAGALAAIGFSHRKTFIRTSPSNYWVSHQHYRKYLFFIIFLPWFIGTVLISILKLPSVIPQHTDVIPHDIYQGAAMIILLFPMLTARISKSIHIEVPENTRKQDIQWRYFILMILLVIVFRLGLTPQCYNFVHGFFK